MKNSYENLEELLENPIFYYFNEISKIPHGSFNEKELSDYILHWAKELGFVAVQDGLNNLLIKKPASKGYENAKPIILQAHMDMVCEKKPEIDHDFRKDPIHLQLDGDILSTGNRTTLGADNGIGVALSMAVLASDSISHPPLDVIVTTAEEEDLSGALGVAAAWFSTNRLINLDNAVDSEVISGSSGGKGAELKLPLDYSTVPADWKSYRIQVSGLKGGHSGEDIHQGLANANILLARLLNQCGKKFNFRIADIHGGNFRLAIPRDADATICLEAKHTATLKQTIAESKDMIGQKYVETDPNLDIQVEEVAFQPQAITEVGGNKIIEAILLSPNGINEMLGSLPVVESSCNLGEVYLEEGHIHLVSEIRATYDCNREYIYEKIDIIGRLLGASVREFAIYPSWTYQAKSELRDITQETYKKLFGENMRNLVVHAGLEPGCFSPKVEELDAIAIGPNLWSLHSIEESASVSSVDKVYQLLTEILKNLH